MTPRPKSAKPTKARLTTLRIDEETRLQMDALRERDGIPYSEQIRRALEQFLELKGVRPKARRKV